MNLILDAGPGADQQEIAELGQKLRREIQQLNVDDVQFLRVGKAPAGAKGDPITMANMAVTLAPVVLTSLFSLLQMWLTRHDKSTVTIEMGGDKIVLSGSPSKEQRDILQAALARHQG
ncbi:MAG TPA: hypothetical protein VGD64_14415 [Acidisarcina sp.]